MRSLVQQTVERLRRYFSRLKSEEKFPEIQVYTLMGGDIEEKWAHNPDVPWILVGTQDQLLSRALNRGYAMSRFKWPVHFGLLNQDCHWVVDEVQLMGPGLWTTAQLDWMRQRRFFALKPCRTTWMSATMESAFLETVDRKREGLDSVKPFDPKLEMDNREEIKQRLGAARLVQRISGARAPEAVADRAQKEHVEGTLTLIVCNTVGAAQKVFQSVGTAAPKILLTSRFRPEERSAGEKALLEFETRRIASGGVVTEHPGLLCVSTQVVEAGVDVSAHRLWSELAPFPSVIQRLGRLNRDGRASDARAYFWKMPSEKGKKNSDYVGPYLKSELDDAEKLLDRLEGFSADQAFVRAMGELEGVEGNRLKKCLQPAPQPLPRALDVHGLFSTEQDVHGGFTDVSAFVRDSDPNPDLTVFWRTWSADFPPKDDELSGPPYDPGEGCAVPVGALKNVLKSGSAKAWTWDDRSARWTAIPAHQLRPGMLIMLHRDAGGYSIDLGWTGSNGDRIARVPPAGPLDSLSADPQTEAGYWSSLAAHLEDAGREAERICDALDLGAKTQNALLRKAVIEAARLHDLGKSHPRWQNALPDARGDEPLAKCPTVIRVEISEVSTGLKDQVRALLPEAASLSDDLSDGRLILRWAVDRVPDRAKLEAIRELQGVKWARRQRFAPGIRHEAASALAMWKRYREPDCRYPALAVYLAAAHHGKVRTVLRSTTDSGTDVFGITDDLDALKLGGKAWPLDFSVFADGASGEWHEQAFFLKDFGWTALVTDLLGPWQAHDEGGAGAVPSIEPRRLGPFALAWLEALVRAADVRASISPSDGRKPSESVHA